MIREMPLRYHVTSYLSMSYMLTSKSMKIQIMGDLLHQSCIIVIMQDCFVSIIFVHMHDSTQVKMILIVLVAVVSQHDQAFSFVLPQCLNFLNLFLWKLQNIWFLIDSAPAQFERF